MKFNATFSMRDVLKQAQTEEAQVGIYLRNGALLSGIVAGVGDHLVVLGQLTEKEFYDALIRMEDISAVEARVRNK